VHVALKGVELGLVKNGVELGGCDSWGMLGWDVILGALCAVCVGFK